MNDALRKFLTYYLLAALLVLTGLAYYFGFNNGRRASNQMKRKARQAYQDAEYKKAASDLAYLLDSLVLDEDPLKLNLAHTAFLIGLGDSSHGLLRDVVNGTLSKDSATLKKQAAEIKYLENIHYYHTLSEEASDKTVASIAGNQLGVLTYRIRDTENADEEEKALTEAAGYFKAALKKNPENQFARYNYELIRKKIDFPRMIISRVKALIAERRYKDARDLLKAALKKDNTIEKRYSDFVPRIENVIKIDSLSRS